LRFFCQTRKTRIDEKKFGFGLGFRFRSGNHFWFEELGAKETGKLHLRLKNWENRYNGAIKKQTFQIKTLIRSGLFLQ